MVFTRSQKRLLETNDNYSNIGCVVKKKKLDNEETDSLTEETEVETEMSCESENEIQLEEVEKSSSQIQNIVKETIKQIVKRFSKSDKDTKNPKEDDEYDTFMEYVDGIYSGNFFERTPVEEKKKRFQKMYTKEEIKQFNDELEILHKIYNETSPSIVDILKMDIHVSQKQKLLEKIHHLTNAEILSSEYNSSLKYLLTNINKTQDQELFELEKQIIKCAQSDDLSDDYRKKILKSKMSFQNKVLAYKRLEVMERYEDSDSSEFAKYKNWMDILLSLPFGTVIEDTLNRNENNVEYLQNVRTVLDKRLSFLEKPKDQILNLVSQMIKNPSFSINAIGLFGCVGTGKSSIVKSMAEALGRPYRAISLGGESDSSMLSGHNFTYVGSSPGRLIEILNETKCMNPVILFDEVDKVSQTHHGKEIIGTLIHLTDSTTNSKYNYDRYFSGIEFDLSKVLFVFTYNDPTKVDRILADRLFKIKVDNYNMKEKLEITNKHIISTILDQYGFTKDDILFKEDSVHYIVHSSKNDKGMRDIKRKFEIIVSRINTLLMTRDNEDIIKLKYKSLQAHYTTLPVTVLPEHIDIFLCDSSTNDMEEKAPPEHMYI
jgi:ATP-dependent Lon protease